LRDDIDKERQLGQSVSAGPCFDRVKSWNRADLHGIAGQAIPGVSSINEPAMIEGRST
jgi:hypothetical protein